MSDSVGIDFKHVLEEEYRYIRNKRAGPEHDEAQTPTPGHPPQNLLGIALSGGGIRSASFCMGALQALDAFGLIKRADYLSTVSGGGYIGAGLIAAMTRDASDTSAFPYTADDVEAGSMRGNDMRDSEAVSHVRDHSRYLIPHGLPDVLTSAAILSRGIAVNLFLVLFLVVPLATVNVLNNPTVDHLDRSILYDIGAWLVPGVEWPPFLAALSTWQWPATLVAESFLATKSMVIAVLIFLIGWGLWKSLPERQRLLLANRGGNELSSKGMRFAKLVIVLLLCVVLLEVQGPILKWLAKTYEEMPGGQTSYQALFVLLAGFVTATATQQKRLAEWIEKGFDSPHFQMKLRAFLSQFLLFIAALIVPLLIYAAYLQISLWGIHWVKFCPVMRIATEPCLPPDSPSFVSSPITGYVLAALIIAMLSFEVWFFSLTDQGRDTLRLLWRRLCNRNNSARCILFGCLSAIAFLILAACVTRADPAMADHVKVAEHQIAFNYVLASVLIVLLTMNFANNANSLHRLYRDRLNVAFRLGGKDAGEALPLHKITPSAPYLLINATLNARMSQGTLTAAEKGVEPTEKPARKKDPAMRGRNAEFFLFSRSFVGSDATGYVSSEKLWLKDPEIHLASAAAISGAAVSSSMGRVKLGLLSPTLALLNLRLGYWLCNPRYVSTAVADLPPDLPWHDFLNAYLIAESFGLLRSDSSKIYVTDGGHIDNIGLYQLLKRQCEHIIIIDAEADPALNFGALVDVQRFARIDLGYRIVLDWQHLREAAAARQKHKGKRISQTETSTHDCHFATGQIDYGGGKKGTLLYIKAIVTGDESDYVLDYERRFPAFPHESTNDQFFSEEQMEAYRALGFHAVRRALTVPKDEASRPEGAASENARWKGVHRMRQALHVTVNTLDQP